MNRQFTDEKRTIGIVMRNSSDWVIADYRPLAELERIYPMGSIRKISGQLANASTAPQNSADQKGAITQKLAFLPPS